MSEFATFIGKFFFLLLKGVQMTVALLVFSAVLSFFLGTVFGVLTCKKLKIPALSNTIDFFTFVLRGIPFFVQLLIVYFVLPDLLSYNLDPFVASVIALGVCSSGYLAQTVRGGIDSIHVSQWEGGFALGFSKLKTFIYIIFPQTFRNVLPMINNEIDALLKSTSIASSIGMLELTRVGMNIVSREMRPVSTYLTVAFFYVCLSALLNIFTRYIERKAIYVKS